MGCPPPGRSVFGGLQTLRGITLTAENPNTRDQIDRTIARPLNTAS
jgi:hypothetical protein